MATRKIVLIGPESTGKSTLTLQLAAYFKAPFVSEYAREFLTAGGKIKTAEDLFLLAQRQITAEKQTLRASQSEWLFCDTDLYNIVVWSQFAFSTVDPRLKKMEEEQRYDLYLLLSPDLPWVFDGIRENPHLREKLYTIYRNRLIEKERSFFDIEGQDNRFQNCLKAILKQYPASKS